MICWTVRRTMIKRFMTIKWSQLMLKISGQVISLSLIIRQATSRRFNWTPLMWRVVKKRKHSWLKTDKLAILASKTWQISTICPPTVKMRGHASYFLKVNKRAISRPSKFAQLKLIFCQTRLITGCSRLTMATNQMSWLYSNPMECCLAEDYWPREVMKVNVCIQMNMIMMPYSEALQKSTTYVCQ